MVEEDFLLMREIRQIADSMLDSPFQAVSLSTHARSLHALFPDCPEFTIRTALQSAFRERSINWTD